MVVEPAGDRCNITKSGMYSLMVLQALSSTIKLWQLLLLLLHSCAPFLLLSVTSWAVDYTKEDMWPIVKADVQYLSLEGSLTDEPSIGKSQQEASSKKSIRPWIIHVLLAIIWSIAFGIVILRGANLNFCNDPDRHSQSSSTDITPSY